MKKKIRSLIVSSCTLIIFVSIFTVTPLVQASSTLSIDVTTNKQSYFLREKVKIDANLTFNGSPVENELVSLRVYNPLGWKIILRAPQNGVPPSDGSIQIVDLYPCNQFGDLKDTFKVGIDRYVYFTVEVKNTGTVAENITVCLNAYDGNDVPFGLAEPTVILLNGTTYTTIRYMPLSYWVRRGVGIVYASVWDANGVPMCCEESALFQLTSRFGIPTSTNPAVASPQGAGIYSSVFRLPYNAMSGTYSAYVKSKHQGQLASSSTTFEVKDASFPPSADFIYHPPSPVAENQTVTFDGTESKAMGYNNSIVSYEWDFDDGTPHEYENITTHSFTTEGTYLVTLNVTDKEGQWGTQTKPITVLEPYGPTANFTYSPPTPYKNTITIFNASASLPGWSGSEVPESIATYTWNFSDGTPLVTEGDPIINHIYTKEGNYTVTLNVTNTRGRWDTTSRNLTVLNVTVLHDVAVISVTPLHPPHSGTFAFPTWAPIDVVVVVKNNGTEIESFTVTAYYSNSSGNYAMGTKPVTDLPAGNQTTLTFKWGLSGVKPATSYVPLFSYPISANASIIPGEINTQNNGKIDGTVQVNKNADGNSDGVISGGDLVVLGKAWGKSPGDPQWNERADYNGDGFISGGDLVVLGKYWGT